MRLIDADALKSFLCKCCNILHSEEPCEPSECNVMAVIDEQPTVEAVEVVHGRWEDETPFDSMCFVCCERNPMGATPFCPNCGAKMDRKDDT